MIIDRLSDIPPRNIYLKCGIAQHFSFFLKLEGINIGGSIKMKTALSFVNTLLQQKILLPGYKLIESSSGNLGVALAMVCAERKIPFICVTDPNTSATKSDLIKAYGAQVIMVNERDKNGGFLGTRLALIEQLLKKDKKLIWTNQYANNANKLAHFHTTAKEIDEFFPRVDYLFIGAGTTGTLMGCAAYYREKNKSTQIIAVDAVGSVTFGGKPAKRQIPGLGTSRKPEIVDPHVVDEIIYISEVETISACRKLFDEKGILVGGSTGTILAAIEKFKNKIKKNSIVIGISPDMGESYIHTIYSDEWIQKNFPAFETLRLESEKLDRYKKSA